MADRVRPVVQDLEDRCLLSVLTVTTNADRMSNPPGGSLRAVLLAAHSGDTIQFAPSMAGETIALQGPLPAITANLTITGLVNADGAPDVTVSGNGQFQPFTLRAGSSSSITNLVIRHGQGPQGGDINNSGTLRLTQVVLADSSTYQFGGGGGAIFNAGTLTLDASLILRCSTNGNGGAIFNAGTMTVTNTTLTGNYGVAGGAVANNGTLTLVNDTIAGNSTNDSGGGIYNSNPYPPDQPAIVNLVNTLVAGNTGTSGPDYWGAVTQGSHSLIGDGSELTGMVNGVNGNRVGTQAQPIDPKLGTLQDNGGPTATMALLPGSPAIDAGTGTGAPHADQRGFNRPVNGVVDMGAYEYQPPVTLTTLVDAPSPSSAVNQPVTFTATVVGAAPGSNTPTGSVTFLENGSAVVTVGLSGGKANFTTTTFAVGTHRLTARYNGYSRGDYTLSPSNSAPVDHRVVKGASLTLVSTTPNPSTVGTGVAISALVASAAPGSITPTGTVTFYADGNSLGSGTINSAGTATVTVDILSVGTHAISATYNGDGNFLVSTSVPRNQVVNAAATATTLAVTPATTTVSQMVSLTATVSPTSANRLTPTGTVTFSEGATVLGTVALSGTTAVLNTHSLGVGSHAITATYNGDGNFTLSHSPPANETVNQAATVTLLDNSPAVITVAQAVTLTATVNAAAANGLGLTGSVRFYDGTTVLGTAALSGGSTVLRTQTLGVGNHSLTAVYSGDVNFLPSTSAARAQQVAKAASTTALSSTPSTAQLHQPITFRATVSPTGAPGLTPTGTVTFSEGGSTLATVPLSGTTANWTTSSLPTGTHAITATYNGDGNFVASAAGVQAVVLSQQGEGGAVAVAVRSSRNPDRVGQNVTFTATVTPLSPGAPAPTGTVTFYDGVGALGTVDLSGNQATFTTSSLAVGRHPISVRYNGDSNYGATPSGQLVQLVSALEIYAIGGAPGRVQVRRVSDNTVLADFAPYGAGYAGEVSVAVGDVNGDGYPDLVVGTITGVAQVKVFDGKAIAQRTFNNFNPDASLLAQWFPLGTQYAVGINVAVGDVSGNGYADVVTAAAAGNPDVRVFSGKDIAQGTFNPNGASLLTQWFAYGLQFNVGANVAVGDVNGDGFADVVTGASIGNPHVKVYSGKDIATGRFNPNGSSVLAQWFAYGLQYNIGVTVAVGDTNGDGYGDIITGAVAGNPHVKVYSGKAIADGSFNGANADGSLLDQFFAYDLQFNVGAMVGAADFSGDGHDEVITGPTRGNPHYRVVPTWESGILPPSYNGMEGILSGFVGGIYVGG
jgi:hypothetical protein